VLFEGFDPNKQILEVEGLIFSKVEVKPVEEVE